MAKKAANSKSVIKSRQSRNPEAIDSSPGPAQRAKHTAIFNNGYFPYLVIFLFSTSLYFNTLWNKYALDDELVLTQNKFTMQGFAGIKDLMTHDASIGFWGEQGKMLSGGRYRPLSMVTFAMEVGFFGLGPAISHAVNILLFTLTCLVLYYLLLYLLPTNKGTPFYLSVPFIATMLFAGHPIHTEVVANIKGRDEILGLLFSLLALFAAIRYVKSRNLLHLIWGAVIFFLALLSKENAITFFAIIPLTYYFFTQAKIKDYALTISLYLIPFIVFLYMRGIYTVTGLSFETHDILNNPFAYLPHDIDGYLQRYATIIMTFILYFKLLIFPHPLTIDYYCNQIPIIGIGDPVFMLSVLVNGGLLVYALMGLKKRKIYSYAILFYFITFSIVSNLLFTVGTLMNERFIYVSSIGFCLLIAWLLVKAKERFGLPVKAVTAAMVLILLLYSIKTISRNCVWEDNLTLFLTDSRTSINSAKVSVAAGVELNNLVNENFDSLRQNGRLQKVANLLDMNVDVKTITDSTLRKEFLRQAIRYINRSLKICPISGAAWYWLADATYKLNKDPNAIGYYENAEALSGGRIFEAWYYMGFIQMENNMPMQAKGNFIKALAFKPDEIACRYRLALAYMNLKINDSALIWFRKTVEVLKPSDAELYCNIGTKCQQLGDIDMAIQCISKAIEYDPNVRFFYENLGMAYNMKNMPDDAIRVSQQCLQKFPGDTASLKMIVISYNKKGDTQKAREYEAKVIQLNVIAPY